MEDNLDIIIEADGEIRFIYSDDLALALGGEGDLEIRRASHVEPATSFGWEADGWLADMRPVGGPLLYASKLDDGRGTKVPFRTRQEALDAERNYLLEKELGL